MIHICICDDSDAMRDELCGLIQALCQKHSIAGLRILLLLRRGIAVRSGR